MIFISVHIPKTAGTSLAHVFDMGTDRAILYDYRSDYSNFMFSEREREEFLEARGYVLSRFSFIHGHFSVRKYQDVLPAAKRVTCFRHPVSRIISQYKHIWFERNELLADYRRIKEGMDIVAFAEQPSIGNAHLLHLDGIPPSELEFIFLNSALEEGLRLFRGKFPGVLRNGWAGLPSVNGGAARESVSEAPRFEVTDTQRTKLAEVIKDELDYYRLAQEAYAGQKRGLLNLAA